MKTRVMVALMAISQFPVQAEQVLRERVFSVTVCTEGDSDTHLANLSQSIASRMFRVIGVGIEWRLGFRGCPPGAILITLSDRTPTGLMPGALAYALPFESAHIRLFQDRIAGSGSATLTPHLRAHVLVHEITHILEGLDSHSVEGVMKAHWTKHDQSTMIWKPLPFTGDDIDLIHLGITARAFRGATRGASASASEPPNVAPRESLAGSPLASDSDDGDAPTSRSPGGLGYAAIW